MSQPDLTIFVPSRARPDNAQDLRESFSRTCTANTQVVFVLDADDPVLYDYFSMAATGLYIVSTTRRGMTQPLNKAFVAYHEAYQLGYAVGFMGDDHRPRTTGWDARYIDAILNMGGVGFVYGDDLFQHERIPTQVAMSTNIPVALGGMVPDQLHHLYVDNYWKLLGEGIGRIKYLPDVVVEHMHYLNGKSAEDATYQSVNSSEMAKHDALAFRHLRRGGLRDDIRKLKALL